LLDRLRRLDPVLVVSAQFNPVRYVDWIVRGLPGRVRRRLRRGRRAGGAGGATCRAAAGPARRHPFDLVVNCDASAPETEKARLLLAALTGRTLADPPALTLRASDRERAAAALRSVGMSSGHYAVCYPAGTKNVTLKAWPPDRYARISAWLARERGLPTLVMGHSSEAGIVDAVVAAAQAAGGAEVRGWHPAESDLDTLVALLASARLYVGNDTGAMHIAAAAGVPVVAVFGGGHWPRFLPIAQRGAVHTRMLPCFGCGWRDCLFFDGPCVGRVEEDAVRASLMTTLDGEDGFRVHAEALPLANPIGPGRWTRSGLFRPARPPSGRIARARAASRVSGAVGPRRSERTG
jgi:hypothetical protein